MKTSIIGAVMKPTYFLSLAFLTLSSLVSTSALAAPGFSNGINIYTSQDGGVNRPVIVGDLIF